MRIVGGEWKGHPIEAPEGRDVTRPTTDRVREAMASMVLSALDVDMGEAHVLDAFGGSGALGIEMLSRGAAHLTVFDIDRGAAGLIRRNLEGLSCDRARYRVVAGDIMASAQRGRALCGPFDLILLDPPYAFGHEPVEGLLADLARNDMLSPRAIAVFEHAAADAGAASDGFTVEREKRYGITAVDLLRYRSE